VCGPEEENMTEAGVGQNVSKQESLADKIRLEEFRGLRGEIELRASEQRAMERNVILLSASIYAFLLYPKDKAAIDPDSEQFLQLAWYLPSLFSFLALVRWRESVKMIEALAKYLKTVEHDVLAGGGWETFLAAERAKGNFPITSRWYLLFWIVACVGTLIVAYLRHPFGARHDIIAAILAIAGTLAVLALVVRRHS
jgi:hypothetical protein